MIPLGTTLATAPRPLFASSALGDDSGRVRSTAADPSVIAADKAIDVRDWTQGEEYPDPAGAIADHTKKRGQ